MSLHTQLPCCCSAALPAAIPCSAAGQSSPSTAVAVHSTVPSAQDQHHLAWRPILTTHSHGIAQGLSSELGAFVAGVMLSATEQQEFTLHQIESIKAFFLSLFVCSTGLVMSPVFLMQHLRILAGGVVLTIASKTLVVRCLLPCLAALEQP